MAEFDKEGLEAAIDAVYRYADGDARQLAEGVLNAYLATSSASVPHVEPVAWRWSFDGCQMTWHYATTKPGKFRFGDPDTLQPLYAAPPAPVSREVVGE